MIRFFFSVHGMAVFFYRDLSICIWIGNVCVLLMDYVFADWVGKWNACTSSAYQKVWKWLDVFCSFRFDWIPNEYLIIHNCNFIWFFFFCKKTEKRKYTGTAIIRNACARFRLCLAHLAALIALGTTNFHPGSLTTSHQHHLLSPVRNEC